MTSLWTAPNRARTTLLRGPLASVRHATDLVIEHSPNPSRAPSAVIKKGPPTGGRSAASGHTATVFGCTGFLGRYLVAKLAKIGTQVIVPYRNEDEKRHLKITGDLGQVIPMEWDVRNPDQIHECLKHSDVVYNLVGRDWETRNFKYDDVNVKGPGLIASVAAESNTPRLVHVSHLNASPTSSSEFYRSKYQGERAVRDAFPEATIVRPAPLFGAEDWLLNAMAQFPILYQLNGGNTKTVPAHVLDVASALCTMLNAPITATASTFVLPGPQAYTYNELLNLVTFFTMKPVPNYPTVPQGLAKLFATILNRALWWPTVSPDEIERKYVDDAGLETLFAPQQESKPSGWGTSGSAAMRGIDGEPVKGWAELDIEPALIEHHAIKYLRRYRDSVNYDVPVELGQFKPPRRYHVVP
ncbi:MAG: hypothetical protein TREMPRED_000769 [Tremellales sp. Tagirdzhanova-0007]|nr:MAG: hypothetical protein TREMPRED_000769 [Tremellales sp. Tagirdzhanova-0007]